MNQKKFPYKKTAAAAVAAAMALSVGCTAATEKENKAPDSGTAMKEPVKEPAKAVPTTDGKPNIILIYTDDLGFGDTSLYGHTAIKTPNINSIAENGALLTQAYTAASVCAPSRAAMLTSVHPTKIGGDNNISMRTSMDQMPKTTIATLLKEKGYSTMAIGKWDLGSKTEFMPAARGFDGFFGFPGGISAYYPRGANKVPADGWHLDPNNKALKGGSLKTKWGENLKEYNPATKTYKSVEEKDYLTDVFTREALEYIDKESADPDPFFLYLAYNASHGPQQAPDDHVQKYAHVAKDQTRLFNAVVDALDEQVGLVLKKLDEKGIRDNTLVIFASDNGPDQAGNPGGLKGRKHDVFEGGIRVPYAIQWPSKIAKNTKFDKVATSLDLLPTITAAAGFDVNELKQKHNIEGVDLTPFITGKNTGNPHDIFFWRQVDDYNLGLEMAARGGDFKYVRVELKNGGVQEYLFNIAKDPQEKTNLFSNPEFKAQANDLKSKLDAWHNAAPISPNVGDGKGGDDE